MQRPRLEGALVQRSFLAEVVGCAMHQMLGVVAAVLLIGIAFPIRTFAELAKLDRTADDSMAKEPAPKPKAQAHVPHMAH